MTHVHPDLQRLLSTEANHAKTAIDDLITTALGTDNDQAVKAYQYLATNITGQTHAETAAFKDHARARKALAATADKIKHATTPGKQQVPTATREGASPSPGITPHLVAIDPNALIMKADGQIVPKNATQEQIDQFNAIKNIAAILPTHMKDDTP